MRRLLVAIGTLGASAVACQVILGIDPVGKVPPPPGAAPLADVVTVDPCAHVQPLGSPDSDDDLKTQLPPFYLALRHVQFDPNNSGLDLDGVCTCDARSGTAFDGGASCVSSAPHCDGDGGVDNEVAAIFGSAVTDVVSFNGIEGVITKGSRNVLFQVSGWNGKPNDKDITFGLLSSTGINDPTGCGPADPPETPTTKHPPGWCGRDKWDYLPNSTNTVAGVVSPAQRGPSWVNGGTLVYRSEASVSFFLGDGTVTFGSAIITGKLEKTPEDRWRFTGILSGRIAINELLAAVGQFQRSSDDGGDSVQLCQSSSYALARVTLCAGLDIAHAKSLDFTGAPCDAVSASVNFVAEEATLGTQDPNPPELMPCDPAKVSDPGLYTCAE